MVERYRKLSGYQVMWVLVIFDLPVGSKEERSRATRFRNSLLDMGFQMVQLSVYLRHAWSREKAESFAQRIGDGVPSEGHVQILFFTDKQYGQSRVFRGGDQPGRPDEKPSQLTLF